jgi:hypothetical protein
MKEILLNKIRLSYYFLFFFVLFVLIEFFVPHFKFEGGALTLFSVNSFLYAFYISPILGAQKTRIEEMHKIVRAESNAIFGMVISIAKLPDKQLDRVKEMLFEYLDHAMRHRRPGGGEEKYEALIHYCLKYEGKYQAEIDKLLTSLIANQANRTNYSMQLSNRVYSNEWMVMIILFSITLSFIMLLDVSEGWIYKILAALLCTGLSMLLVILVKMSTLTHKKAKQIWTPYKRLIDTDFYRID